MSARARSALAAGLGRLVRGAGALVLAAGAVLPAAAHPVSQGALDVRVEPDVVRVRATVPTEQAFVASALSGEADEAPITPAELWEQHGRYLLSHLRIALDGAPLVGRLVWTAAPGTRAPDGRAGGVTPTDRIVYELSYERPPRAGAAAASPELRIEQDLLGEISPAPGLRWETTFVTRIESAGRTAAAGLLLTSRAPLVQRLGPAAAGRAARRVFFEYLRHGLTHILAGPDHLLFVGALVLATVTLLDLVKIVTAFTLAHTITLTLAVLDLVRLPPRIVEPMIAASIVYVALENVLRPERARRTGRLVVAFVFGLFHGLGFAGGLLAAMEGMAGAGVGLAILAFSAGVEIGHQIVALPLFALLRLTGRGQEPDGVRLSLLRRGGSALISVAGLVYFVAALRGV